jgi:hypothetical protein
MIHSEAGLSQNSKKKNTSGKTGNSACFWLWKNYLPEFLQLCPKKGILTVQRKKNPLRIGKWKNRNG